VTDTDAPDQPAHLELLRLLEVHPDYSQRQLSSKLGLSLGKTHYLLRALLDKGLVKAQNFRRNGNKLGYLYMLTPSGMRQKMRLTRAFLNTKEREYHALSRQIAALRAELGDPVEISPQRNTQARDS
jgi:EPS-associated MarR family transcriptional regulator